MFKNNEKYRNYEQKFIQICKLCKKINEKCK